MKQKVIEFCRSHGYWRTAYSGKDKTLYIHISSIYDDYIDAAIKEKFPIPPFKIEIQMD